MDHEGHGRMPAGTPERPRGDPGGQGMSHGPSQAGVSGMNGMSGMMSHGTPWVQPILMLLGLWLIASPSALAYGSAALAWSDVVSGLLVIAIAAWGFWRPALWTGYANALVGVWLLSAPLLFWAPTPAAYLNDTLVGTLVISFAILFPHSMAAGGPERPAGWSYNPSTWWQRAPMVALGFGGFFLARYMAAYQLGHIPDAWDPFFGNGTVLVLDSEVAAAFPVSDAGMGAWVYLIEGLMGLMGDPRRWRTMPWMVTFFGILVVPLGVVSILLIAMQPVVVGAWCTVCLLTALLTLLMIPLALDEVIAMVQYVLRARRAGRPVWSTFWLGGPGLEGDGDDERVPKPGGPAGRLAAAMVWGVTLPWTLLASAALGVWMMFASFVVPVSDRLADSNAVTGALIVTWALIALAEVARPARYLNLALGAWLIASPLILGGAGTAALVMNVLAGALILALSLPRGTILERSGGWLRAQH